TVNGVTNFAGPQNTLLLRAGAGNYEVTGSGTRNRWGDYSATSRDPSDPGIFWTTQEYVSSTNNWATHIAEIVIPTSASETRWKSASSGMYATGANWNFGTRPSSTAHTILSRPTAGAYTISFN